MTKTTKLITALALGSSILLTGCFDESGNKDKYIKYSEYAGTAVGYLINSSGKALGPETKKVIVDVIGEMTEKLPKEVTAETISEEMSKIAADVISKSHISTQYVEVVTKSVDTLLTMLNTALYTVKAKYPIEFSNGEIFYSIAYTFISSANSVLDFNSSRNSIEETEFAITLAKYSEVNSMAKVNGNKINKKTFDDIIASLEELTK